MNRKTTPSALANRSEGHQPDLGRFVTAQAENFCQAVAELRAGEKRTHWMWYVFPQLACRGRSDTAKYYGIRDLNEAQAYLAHPLLGTRLVECSAQVLAVTGRTAHKIFGETDARKFQSCMTLFAAADPNQLVFQQCLDKYYGGGQDMATWRAL